jgi:formamidopyrimidine-DNA glycosylase
LGGFVPELPEVETVRRGLQHLTLNSPILGGEVLLARTIANPDSAAAFLQGVQGAAIAQWQRRGKYLLAQLVCQPFCPQSSKVSAQSRGWLGVHLRMSGQLLWLNPTVPLHKHTRVRLFFGDRPEELQELRFVDQRTFGQLWWVPPDRQPADIIPALSRLGPEPFDPEFSVGYLSQNLRQRRSPIKSVLLNQSLVAGVGNIYADESLFKSRIHPQTPAASLNSKQLQRLHFALLDVLQTAIAAGGTSFSDFLHVNGVNGNYGGTAWVYNRRGEPCRICATPIQRLKLAGRSSHFCPHCQPHCQPHF